MPILIWFILLSDALLGRKPKERARDAQARTDAATASLRLYHFQACPYCRKVRRDIRLLGLNIAQADIKLDPQAKRDLLAGGGDKMVPCLRIEEGESVRWLYQSKSISAYLSERFA